ncbi:OmpA family protein [Aurantiacibacter gangjinensis]|uniref:OmpA family protein n=1 Tax=Aurantiacibacter gangjinensis TaxID=502682 RepID=A0A0G9MT97_9SPHN|nr:OmpA family protein [Aurantiacibacter gangjinensis]APE28308.1 Outer membrane protein A precursor [Aurantiacibacter gangjinensis]KLE32548.1 OmpA family protein [Aurantiacibacter gangjinensis]
MKTLAYKSAPLALLAAMALPATAVAAQELPQTDVAADGDINVYGQLPADLDALPDGPELEGFISARSGNNVQVTTESGEQLFLVAPTTDIRARGGFLGLGRTTLTASALMNGLPVSVETVQWAGGLIASQVRFSDNDLETAQMIATGTNQRFVANEEATEALRGRVANIDNYNVMEATNVYFDTGRHNLSPQAERNLCNAAAQAEATDNALILVVGYTDDVGDYDYNQELSERRATRVVNYLQQQCGWEPWRMMTPTGMAEADPAADNSTEAGRAQNRRVSVNILVSKAVEGMGG